jgi:hypothetical protein
MKKSRVSPVISSDLARDHSVMGTGPSYDHVRSRRAERDQRGEILVFALIFLIVVSLTVAMIASWASNSLKDTVAFSTSSSLQYATGAAVQMEAQILRYAWQPTSESFDNCTPGTGSTLVNGTSVASVTINKVAVTVYCSIVDGVDSAASRVVVFDSCVATESESNCLNYPYLQATISFDDYSEQNDLNCDSASDELSCGTGMSITAWEVV